MPAASQGKRGPLRASVSPFQQGGSPWGHPLCPGTEPGMQPARGRGPGDPQPGQHKGRQQLFSPAQGRAPQLPGLSESWAAPCLSPLW